MNVCLVTEYAENYRPIADITLPVLHEYRDKHGYQSVEIRLDDGHRYAYKKHECFQDILRSDVDVIAYFDIDCLITNLFRKTEHFLDDKHDFYITRDFTELNGGAILLKNTEWAHAFNDFILYQRNNFENEQNVYNYFQNLLKPKMKVVQHPAFNSYKYSLYPECGSHVGKPELGDWSEGQFCLHVPALSMTQRVEVLRNTKIIR